MKRLSTQIISKPSHRSVATVRWITKQELEANESKWVVKQDVVRSAGGQLVGRYDPGDNAVITNFRLAVDLVRATRAKTPHVFAPQDQAKLYALYKQATFGDYIIVEEESNQHPNQLAWLQLVGTSPHQAMQAYIELVQKRCNE